jgi:tetratricopeptide (TPR) repeat protein
MLGTRRTAHRAAVGFGRDPPSVRVDLRVRALRGELLAGGILPEVAEHKALLGRLAIGMPATRFVRQGAMLKSSLICSAVCLATLSISAGAQAQASRDWTECVNEGDAVSLDVMIGGCNNLIQSGKETPAKLAEAYSSRGIAYAKRREYDQAIADYDKAIELDPKNAKAYYRRGYVYDIKGEHDRAMADYNKAMGLLSRRF